MKKKSFANRLLRLAGRVFCTQIASVLTYVVMMLVVMTLFDHTEEKAMSPVYLIATFVTQFSVLLILYQPLWLFGEDHATDLKIGKIRPLPVAGLLIGAIGISPAILAWLCMWIFALLGIQSSVVNDILGYMLYAWAPYFELIPHNGWYASLFYLPAILPVPLTCQIAFYRGLHGKNLKKTIRQRRSSSV